ncbi:MAG: leucine-rich repeat domain-containing protein, partial [Oscillospiraceae bacterium]|nr:leucine-rich repeat domain-containing protein [Oscillospiraceae bacterium]
MSQKVTNRLKQLLAAALTLALLLGTPSFPVTATQIPPEEVRLVSAENAQGTDDTIRVTFNMPVRFTTVTPRIVAADNLSDGLSQGIPVSSSPESVTAINAFENGAFTYSSCYELNFSNPLFNGGYVCFLDGIYDGQLATVCGINGSLLEPDENSGHMFDFAAAPYTLYNYISEVTLPSPREAVLSFWETPVLPEENPAQSVWVSGSEGETRVPSGFEALGENVFKATFSEALPNSGVIFLSGQNAPGGVCLAEFESPWVYLKSAEYVDETHVLARFSGEIVFDTEYPESIFAAEESGGSPDSAGWRTLGAGLERLGAGLYEITLEGSVNEDCFFSVICETAGPEGTGQISYLRAADGKRVYSEKYTVEAQTYGISYTELKVKTSLVSARKSAGNAVTFKFNRSVDLTGAVILLNSAFDCAIPVLITDTGARTRTAYFDREIPEESTLFINALDDEFEIPVRDYASFISAETVNPDIGLIRLVFDRPVSVKPRSLLINGTIPADTREVKDGGFEPFYENAAVVNGREYSGSIVLKFMPPTVGTLPKESVLTISGGQNGLLFESAVLDFEGERVSCGQDGASAQGIRAGVYARLLSARKTSAQSVTVEFDEPVRFKTPDTAAFIFASAHGTPEGGETVPAQSVSAAEAGGDWAARYVITFATELPGAGQIRLTEDRATLQDDGDRFAIGGLLETLSGKKIAASTFHRGSQSDEAHISYTASAAPQMTAFSLCAELYTPEDAFTFDAAAGTVTGYTGNETNVKVPPLIAGIPVLKIGASAFSGNTALMSVTLPESVTTVETSAFRNCVGLIDLTLLNGTQLIGDSAFYGCAKLSELFLPASVTAIAQNAFGYCVSLTAVTFETGSALVTVGNNAFANCQKLISMVLPDGLQTVGTGAFMTCKTLRKVLLPGSLTALGQTAFKYCASLEGIYIAGGLTEVKPESFANCPALVGVFLPPTVTAVSPSAFNSAPGVTIYGVTGSAAEAYAASKSIPFAEWETPSIQINDYDTTVTCENVIVTAAATNCTLLEASHTFELNGSFTFAAKDIFGNLYTRTVTVTNIDKTFVFTSSGELTGYGGSGANVVIPAEIGGVMITAIGASAFKNNTFVTSVTLPVGLTQIGAEAFSGCAALTLIALPQGLDAIGAEAFEGCRNLAAVSLPDTLCSIGEYAFSDCQKLTAAAIPSSVTAMGSSVFRNCRALLSAVLPTGLSILPEYTFYGCVKLINVTIPANISKIGTNAFGFCIAMNGVYFDGGSALTEIGEQAFANCGNLSFISLPEGLQAIKSYAFSGCSLVSVTIPASVRLINQYAFYTASLQNVEFLGVVHTVSSTAFIGGNVAYCPTGEDVRNAINAGKKQIFIENVSESDDLYDNSVYFSETLVIPAGVTVNLIGGNWLEISGGVMVHGRLEALDFGRYTVIGIYGGDFVVASDGFLGGRGIELWDYSETYSVCRMEGGADLTEFHCGFANLEIASGSQDLRFTDSYVKPNFESTGSGSIEFINCGLGDYGIYINHRGAGNITISGSTLGEYGLIVHGFSSGSFTVENCDVYTDGNWGMFLSLHGTGTISVINSTIEIHDQYQHPYYVGIDGEYPGIRVEGELKGLLDISGNTIRGADYGVIFHDFETAPAPYIPHANISGNTFKYCRSSLIASGWEYGVGCGALTFSGNVEEGYGADGGVYVEYFGRGNTVITGNTVKYISLLQRDSNVDISGNTLRSSRDIAIFGMNYGSGSTRIHLNNISYFHGMGIAFSHPGTGALEIFENVFSHSLDNTVNVLRFVLNNLGISEVAIYGNTLDGNAYDKVSIYGYLNRDLSFTGDLYSVGNDLNLNGYALRVNGNFYQHGGSVNLSGGALNATGIYSLADGTLDMSGGNMTAGNLTQVGGSVTLNGGNLTVADRYDLLYGKLCVSGGRVTVNGYFYANSSAEVALQSWDDLKNVRLLDNWFASSDIITTQNVGFAPNAYARWNHTVKNNPHSNGWNESSPDSIGYLFVRTLWREGNYDFVEYPRFNPDGSFDRLKRGYIESGSICFGVPENDYPEWQWYTKANTPVYDMPNMVHQIGTISATTAQRRFLDEDGDYYYIEYKLENEITPKRGYISKNRLIQGPQHVIISESDIQLYVGESLQLHVEFPGSGAEVDKSVYWTPT